MTREQLAVDYGERTIEFCLERRDRKTMAISVAPDLSVEVVAPRTATIDDVLGKVRRRAPWIMKQVRFFAQFQPRTPERKYIAGETQLYLGRQYKLKVVAHTEDSVSLARGQLIVKSRTPEERRKTENLVEQWLLGRANLKFKERIRCCSQLFADPAAFEPTSLTVRQMSQRWGSMSSAGRLILNRKLIRASIDAIDYVITHELCHMRHPNHNNEFISLLGQVMPDWNKRKMKLERQLA